MFTPKALVSVVVAVLVVLVVAVPVISAQEITEPVERMNSGGVPMSSYDGIDIDISVASNVLSINGEAVTAPAADASIVSSRTLQVFYDHGVGYNFGFYVSTPPVTFTATGDWTLSVEPDGDWTLSANENTYSGSTDDVLAYDTDGDLMYFAPGSTAVVNSRATMTLVVPFTPNGQHIAWGKTSSPSSGEAGLILYNINGTRDDITVSWTAVQDDGAWSIGSVFENYPGYDPIACGFIVPAQYTAYVETEGSLTSIVDIIPVLLTVGVLMGAVRLFLMRD